MLKVLQQKNLDVRGSCPILFHCICLVGMKKGTHRTIKAFVKTKEYVWRQNEDYLEVATC